MGTSERVTRLIARLSQLGQAADEAMVEVMGLERDVAGVEAVHWLPGLKEALERIQLDCAEARYAARELRAALPGTDTLQPRLL